MYIKRDHEHRIERVSRDETPECNEYMAADSSELLAFLMEGESAPGAARLQASDLAFVRVLEDVIEVLMDKGVISFTDLPEPAQQKVMERQSLRRRLNSVELMQNHDEEGGGVI